MVFREIAKKYHSILSFFCFIVLVSLCLSCGSKKTYKAVTVTKKANFPEAISFVLSIADYDVKNIRAVSEMGDIDKFIFVNSWRRIDKGPYVKLNPISSRDRCPCFYFIEMEIPVKNGNTEVIARKFSYDDIPHSPPEKFTIRIIIKNKYLIPPIIFENLGPEKRGMYVPLKDPFHDRGGERFVVIKSTFYPNAQWEFMLPKDDGTFKSKAILTS